MGTSDFWSQSNNWSNFKPDAYKKGEKLDIDALSEKLKINKLMLYSLFEQADTDGNGQIDQDNSEQHNELQSFLNSLNAKFSVQICKQDKNKNVYEYTDNDGKQITEEYDNNGELLRKIVQLPISKNTAGAAKDLNSAVITTYNQGKLSKKEIKKDGKIVETYTYTYNSSDKGMEFVTIKREMDDGSENTVNTLFIDNDGNTYGFAVLSYLEKNAKGEKSVVKTENGVQETVLDNDGNGKVKLYNTMDAIKYSKAPLLAERYIKDDKAYDVQYDGKGNSIVFAKNNDSFEGIAKRFGMTVQELHKLNPKLKTLKIGDAVFVKGIYSADSKEVISQGDRNVELNKYNKYVAEPEYIYKNNYSSIDKTIYEQLNKVFKVSQENHLFYLRFSKLKPEQQRNALNIVKYCLTNKITDTEKIKSKILEAFPNINLFDSGLSVPVGKQNKNAPAFQKNNSVISLEQFIKDVLKLDIKQGFGKDMYDRLSSLSQEELNKISVSDFKNLNKVTFDNVAEIFSTLGVNIRDIKDVVTRSEQQAVYRRFAAQMLSNIYRQAAQLLHSHLHSKGLGSLVIEDSRIVVDAIAQHFTDFFKCEPRLIAEYERLADKFEKNVDSASFAHDFEKATGGTPYNEMAIQNLMEAYNETNGDFNSEKFKSACKKAFGFRGLENTNNRIESEDNAGFVADALLMVATMGLYSETKAAQIFAQGLNKGLSSLIQSQVGWSKAGQYITQEAASLLTNMIISAGTMAEYSGISRGLLNATDVFNADWNMSLEEMKGSAQFGAFAGAWGEIAVAPFMKMIQRPLAKTSTAVTKLLKGNTKITGKEIMETFLDKQTPEQLFHSIISTIPEGLGFGAYEAAIMAMENERDTVTGKKLADMNYDEAMDYIMRSLGNQAKQLGVFKAAGAYVLWCKGGNIARKAMFAKMKDECKELKDINITTETFNGEDFIIVESHGQKFATKNINDVINFCQLSMYQGTFAPIIMTKGEEGLKEAYNYDFAKQVEQHIETNGEPFKLDENRKITKGPDGIYRLVINSDGKEVVVRADAVEKFLKIGTEYDVNLETGELVEVNAVAGVNTGVTPQGAKAGLQEVHADILQDYAKKHSQEAVNRLKELVSKAEQGYNAADTDAALVEYVRLCDKLLEVKTNDDYNLLVSRINDSLMQIEGCSEADLSILCDYYQLAEQARVNKNNIVEDSGATSRFSLEQENINIRLNELVQKAQDSESPADTDAALVEYVRLCDKMKDVKTHTEQDALLEEMNALMKEIAENGANETDMTALADYYTSIIQEVDNRLHIRTTSATKAGENAGAGVNDGVNTGVNETSKQTNYKDLILKTSKKIKNLIESNPELKNDKWLQENIENLLYVCEHPYSNYTGYTLGEQVKNIYKATTSAIQHPLLIKHRLEVLETILQNPEIIKNAHGYNLHSLLGKINNSQAANNIIESIKHFNNKYQNNQNCLKHIEDVVFNTESDINDKKVLLDLISKHDFIANCPYLGSINSHNKIALMNKLINDNDFPNEYVVNIVEKIHKYNVEIANKLCNDKDFPKQYIANILLHINSNNVKTANIMLFDKNFNIEDVLEILINRTGVESVEYTYQLALNYNQLGIYTNQILPLIRSQGILSVESVAKLNKIIDKQRATELTSDELKVLANNTDIFGKKNIEDLSKTEKRNLLESILLNKGATESGKLSNIKDLLPFYPNNTVEYGRTISILTQSLNIRNTAVTTDITKFNQQIDNLAKTIQNALPESLSNVSLKISHEDFINKINNILKTLPKEEQTKIQTMFGFKIIDNNLTGYPNSDISTDGISESYKNEISEVKSAIDEYTNKNNVIITAAPKLSNILNNIIKACPEIMSQADSAGTLSKTLQQLQRITQSDNFDNLSAQDKQIMVVATLLNNIDPSINTRTDAAFDAYNICKRLNMNDYSARKLLTMIEFSDAPERFMNTTKEKTSIQRRLLWEGQQRHDTFDYLALKLRAGNLFPMTQMLYSTNYVDGFTRNFDKQLQAKINEYKSNDFSLLQTPKEIYDEHAVEEVHKRGDKEYKVKVVYSSSIPNFYALTHSIEAGMTSRGSLEANYDNFEILCAPYNDKVVCASFISGDMAGAVKSFKNVLIIEADNYNQFVAHRRDLSSDSRIQQDLVIEYFRPHSDKHLKEKNEEREYVSKYLKQELYGKYYTKVFNVDKAYRQRYDNIIRQLNGEPMSIERLEMIDPEFADAFKSFLASDKTILDNEHWNEALVTPKNIIAVATTDINKLPEFYLQKAAQGDLKIVVVDGSVKKGAAAVVGENAGVKPEIKPAEDNGSKQKGQDNGGVVYSSMFPMPSRRLVNHAAQTFSRAAQSVRNAAKSVKNWFEVENEYETKSTEKDEQNKVSKAYIDCSNKVFEVKPDDIGELNPVKFNEAQQAVDALRATEPKEADELQIVLDMFKNPTKDVDVTDAQISAVAKFIFHQYDSKKVELDESAKNNNLDKHGKFGSRIKSEASLKVKLENYIKDAIEDRKEDPKKPVRTLLEAFINVRDAYACRTEFEKAIKGNYADPAKITELENNMNQEKSSAAYKLMAQERERRKEIVELLREADGYRIMGNTELANEKMLDVYRVAAEIQSQPYVEEIKSLLDRIKTENNDVTVMRLTNYTSEDGIPVISIRQLRELKDYGAAVGVNVEFIHLKKEIRDKREEFLSSIKLRPTGYTSLQVNFITKTGEVYEHQFRGILSGKLAESEHPLYDLRTGKCPWLLHPELEYLYKPLGDLISKDNMPEEAYENHQRYLAEYNAHLRKLELGFESEAPKLEDYEVYTDKDGVEQRFKFDKRLSAENLMILDDIAKDVTAKRIAKENSLAEYHKAIGAKLLEGGILDINLEEISPVADKLALREQAARNGELPAVKKVEFDDTYGVSYQASTNPFESTVTYYNGKKCATNKNELRAQLVEQGFDFKNVENERFFESLTNICKTKEDFIRASILIQGNTLNSYEARSEYRLLEKFHDNEDAAILNMLFNIGYGRSGNLISKNNMYYVGEVVKNIKNNPILFELYKEGASLLSASQTGNKYHYYILTDAAQCVKTQEQLQAVLKIIKENVKKGVNPPINTIVIDASINDFCDSAENIDNYIQLYHLLTGYDYNSIKPVLNSKERLKSFVEIQKMLKPKVFSTISPNSFGPVLTRLFKDKILPEKKVIQYANSCLNTEKFLNEAVYETAKKYYDAAVQKGENTILIYLNIVKDGLNKETIETALKDAKSKKNQIKSGLEDITDNDIEKFFADNTVGIQEAINLVGKSAFEYSFTSKIDGMERLCDAAEELYKNYNDLIRVLNSVKNDKSIDQKMLEQRLPELEKMIADEIKLLNNVKTVLSDKSIEPQEKIKKLETLGALKLHCNEEEFNNFINIIKPNKPTSAQVQLAAQIWSNTKAFYENKWNAFCEAFGVEKDNAKVKAFFEKRATLNAKGYKILNGVKSADMQQFLSSIVREQNQRVWNDACNKKVFDVVGATYTEEVSRKLDLASSPDLDLILASGDDFKSTFRLMIERLNEHPEMSVKETFDNLAQNLETKRQYAERNVDYDKITTPDKDSYKTVKIKVDAEKTRQNCVTNLVNEFNDEAFKNLPKEETQKLLNALKNELGIELKAISEPQYDADGYVTGQKEALQFFNADGTPIAFNNLGKMMSVIKKAMNANDFWSTKNSNTQIEQYKSTFYDHIMKARDEEISNAENIKSDKTTEVSIQQVDMNEMPYGLMLGAKLCCTSPTGCNAFSAPTYVMNKCIGAFDIKDGKVPVGNTMMYFAEIDGRTCLVLDNIEVKSGYQDNVVRDAFMEYVKEWCTEKGLGDIPIYAGPNRHKFDMNGVYPVENHNVKIIGSTGLDEIYIDYHGHTIVDGNSTIDNVSMFVIRPPKQN